MRCDPDRGRTLRISPVRTLRAWRPTAAPAIAIALFLSACGGGDGDQRAELRSEPTTGEWQTWVLPSGSSIEVPPPPEEGSAAARRDSDQLRAAVRSRTGRDEETARALEREPAVEPWLRDVMSYVAARPKDPPGASRNYALVSVAMHDAVVAAWHWKYEYRRKAPGGETLFDPPADPSYPSEHAVIAGAASRVLAHLYPEVPEVRLERQAQEIASSRVAAGVSYPSDVKAGMALGRTVAERVIRYADADGADRKWDGKRPGPAPRYWEPPPGSAARPVRPLAGTWKTWVMESGSQFRPPPPPRFGTPGFLEQVRATIRAQDNLTEKQKRAAKFWQGGEGTALPPGIWIQVVLEQLHEQPLTTPRAARVFALLNVAQADAGVAAWDAKYKYWYPRPENGIRDSGLDKQWKPYVETPLFPAYVSGHATYSAAAGEVLAHIYPEDAKLWRARAQEAAMSRVWGGIHWPVDGEFGARLGRKIGGLVVARAERDGAER